MEVSNLTCQFSGKKVLNQINLRIEKGEIFGLLGPSGAGKTTLINILTGQIRQTEGMARIMGENTQVLSGKYYKKIGMMLDQSGLYERLSCYDNLELFSSLFDISKKEIDRVLNQVGLIEAKKTMVMKLSKGMKQRLILARAIMNSPEVLFLDEPTSGLDPGTAREIHELIKEQQEKGTTIFLTTHNMEEANKLCDHIALLHQGDIVEYGRPEEICRRFNNQNKLQLLLKDGRMIILPNDKSIAKEMLSYIEEEMLVSIHSTEPNLETVFMELTGRGFIE